MTLPNRNSKANARRRSESELVDWVLTSSTTLDPGREMRLRAHRASRLERLRRREAQRLADQMITLRSLAGEFGAGEG